MMKFTPRMTSAVDTLPPLPPSTSQNNPLQVSSNEICSVHVELEKSYFINNDVINGTVHLTLYQRQFLHSIQIHLGGFEKIYTQSMLNTEQTNNLSWNNNNHIIPFYSESRVIFPPQLQNDVGIATSSTTSTSHSPTGSSSKLSSPLGSSSSSISPLSSSSSISSSGSISSASSSSTNSNNPHTAYRYTAPSNQGGQQNSQSTSPVMRSNDATELEPGTYHYSFSIPLPRFLAPSMNYIDFLSIFYIAKCVIEYSKGREWQETSIARSTEFFVHGVGNNQLARLMAERRFVSARVSRFLWTNKSRPVEMAVCLGSVDCFIGEKANFFVKIRNLSPGIDSLQLDFFQKIFLMLPGTASKQPLASTKMLTASFDIRSKIKDSSISSAQFQVVIPQMVGDDVVFPSMRGCISRIKHYFKVSIPSAKVETTLKFNLHGRLVGEEQALPKTPKPVDWQISWMPTWVREEDKTVKCTLCAEQFNIIIRKHHCRSCGNVFCGKCASSKLYLKKYGVNDERVRVCALCHDDIMAAEEQKGLNTPKKRYQPYLVEI